MKTVLCYGDSITWGFNPVDGSRFPFERRWPGVLQAALGGGYRVIEEASAVVRSLPTRGYCRIAMAARCSARSLSRIRRLTGWSSFSVQTTADQRIIAMSATSRTDVPRCSGSCRSLALGQVAEPHRCSSSRHHTSASSRRSCNFSFGAARRPALDWRPHTPRSLRLAAPVSWMLRVFSPRSGRRGASRR